MNDSRRRAISFAVVSGSFVLLAAFAMVTFRVSSRVAAGLHPARQPLTAPTGLDSVQTILVETRDHVRIRGWYVSSREGALIVLVHGYGAARTQLLTEARALKAAGYGVVLFDLRGHGESGGEGTTWGVREQLDLEGILDFVATRPEIDRNRIGALGFSIGAMVVAQVAARDPRIRAVVLEGGYTSLEDMARHDENRWGRWSEWVATATLRREGIDLNRLRPVDVICRISPRPILIINGSADEDTPPSTARSLFRSGCEPKELWLIPSARHTGYAAAAGPALGERIVRFFDASLPRAPGAVLAH
jgi:dipeptidyl aminopeptidase/acylaminoacyl peptidase